MREIFNEIKESLTMKQVMEHFGYSVNRSGFIHSPFKEERTASCKCYERSFYDFSSGTGGDCVRFASLVLGKDNWQAAKYLCEVFSLPIPLSDTAAYREAIERRQREQQRQEERQQEFKAALFGEIDSLKRWTDIYRTAIEKQLYEPFSDMWAYCTNELQVAEYKLDILCGVDQEAYRRMKPKVELGLSSDRPQWLLDTLAILEEVGAFKATQSELAEIQAQRDFELLERQPGKDRVCNIEWIKNVLRNQYEQQEKGGEVKRKRKKQIRNKNWTELSQILNFR